MRVTVTTDGGFTGRGIGSASAEVDDETVASARPETWQPRYEAPGADLVRYTLRAGGRTVTWTDGAKIPAGLRELFERVWSSRA